MADTGKQSPLGVNSLSTLLNNTGLQINPVFAGYVGTSHTRPAYSFGSLCSATCLRLVTWSINDAYVRGVTGSGPNKTVNDPTFENLIRIGVYPTLTIPALGNAKALTFTWDKSADPGAASIEQTYSWNPYTLLNPTPAVRDITSWGYVRLFALQGWDEFNYNYGLPEYRDFLSSFMVASGFTDYSNQAIMAVQNSKTFLDGTYSNMNDLMSADILGVNLATPVFGLDLIDLGKAINLITIDTFGLPSKLLLTLQKFNAITASVSLALQSTELTYDEISFILSDTGTPTPAQEFNIYQAFTIIGNQDLADILVPLNCKTQGLSTLADLLNVKLLFPRSYSSLTVPIYNTTQSTVNSKIYYPIYAASSVNPNLSLPSVQQAVGTVVSTSLPTIVTSVSPVTFAPQEPPIGFGSYLQNILPADIAIAAGAFSATMLQVRNIQSVPIEKFAQAVTNIETTTGLSVNGSSVPVNTALANSAADKIALGSGPVGTYTTSNFFGCMSGLPYPVADIQSNILGIQTQKLLNIYHELFLAVTWEKAKLSISQPYWWVVTVPYVAPTIGNNPANPGYQPDPGILVPPYDPYPYLNGGGGGGTYSPTYWATSGTQEQYDWWYSVAITLSARGGGYGRGTAPDLTMLNGGVVLSPNNCKATASAIVGRNDADAASVGGGTFGRITSAAINNGGNYKWDHTLQTNWVNIQGQDTTVSPTPPINPPHDLTWVQANIPLETVKLGHAPVETLPVSVLGAIATTGVNSVGDTWSDPILHPSAAGLVAAGNNGWSAMNGPVQSYITQANEEIAAIKIKSPSGAAQLNVLWDITGTQLMIEQRARWTCFIPVPIPRNDYLSRFPITHYSFIDSMPKYALKTEPHMYAQTIEAITDWTGIGGQSIIAMMRQERNQSVLSITGISLDNNIPVAVPYPSTAALITNGTLPEAVSGTGVNFNGVEFTIPAILVVTDPTGNTVTPVPVGTYTPRDNTFTPFTQWLVVDPNAGGNVDPNGGSGTQPPVDPLPGDGYPGSLGGSPYVGVIPPNVNTSFTSSQLIPSTVTPGAALGEIIINNCNCWS